MKTAWVIALMLFSSVLFGAEEIQKYSFAPPQDMIRADLYVLKTPQPPKAVLVLCPGANGNGEGMIRQQEWQEFVREQHVGLVGLSFASEGEFLNDGGRGYYYASKGSGQTLLDGIREIYGWDIPLLFYGISGGAHFTSRFVEWKPDRVISWCAYTAGWWDTPHKAAINPPGIVACGDADPRYGATMIYFKQGRAADKPWIWISLHNVGHTSYPPLEEFARSYFITALSPDQKKGLWVDIDLEKPTTELLRKEQPSLTGWLPDIGLFEEWKAINEP